jgi:N-acetylmuramoyl-L-alanine amidase
MTAPRSSSGRSLLAVVVAVVGLAVGAPVAAAGPRAAPAAADPDPSVAAFAALKKDVEALRSDVEKKKFRHHYDKLIVRLQAVANTYPQGSRADDCAFVAAQLLEELAQVSVTSADRAAAVDAFASMADRFPKSNLADDALVAAARLTDDVTRGRAMVDKVLAMKGADFKKEAEHLKKTRFTDVAVAAAAKEAKLAAARPASKPESKPESKPAPKADKEGPPPSSSPKGEAPTVASALARVADVAPPKPDHDHDHDHDHDAPPPSEVGAPSTVSAVRTAPPLAPLLVLPERPPLGTPSRKVMVIRHEKTDADSIIRFRISGEVGVLRGDVPAKDGAGRRIFYDVAPAKLGQRNIEPIEVHDGVVARVRAGQYDTDIVRLVIELEGDREPSLFISKKPFELVLSTPLPGAALATSTTLPTADVVAGVIPVPPKLPPPPDASEVRARLSQGLPSKPGVKDGVSISQQLGLKVHRVVIDAGHGGHDTGAIGPSGIKEKDITLQLAQRVKAKLNAELPDIEVIMTREDDRTLALQDRTNTANSAAADLFISIHCNASPIKRVRGVETYYLNITHDRYAMRLAARENAELGDGSISDLDFILADLAMKSNVDDSVRLGRSVQGAMMKKLHRHWPDVPDLGLKHALFYVLMGNRMPSILVETSFLSNKQEEKRLASSEYQEAIADGVVEGVRTFVAERQAFFAGP